jgi:hypothetical protein
MRTHVRKGAGRIGNGECGLPAALKRRPEHVVPENEYVVPETGRSLRSRAQGIPRRSRGLQVPVLLTGGSNHSRLPFGPNR